MKKRKLLKFKNNLPLGALFISVYYIFGSFITFVIGTATLFFPTKIGETLLLNNAQLSSIDPLILSKVLMISAIVFIIVGYIGMFAGISMLLKKKWARYYIIFVSLFSFFTAIVTVLSISLQGIIGLLLNGIIAGYLIFNKQVKKAFI